MDKNNDKQASWFPHILSILLCLILVIIIYYPVFLKGYWAVNRSDALNIHLPNNSLIASVFHRGQFPLWNPRVNLGQPIIDGFSLIFHPALVLYLFFTPWLANSIEILLGLALALLGTWYFLRQQGLKVYPASVGMLVYVLSGPVFSLHAYHLDFMAIVLLPWSLWVFHQYDRTKYLRWLWAAAILCVLAVQSIELDTLFYFYLALFIDRLVCIPKDKNERKIYAIKWVVIFILSCLTGLLSYLPLYEWLFYSSRLSKSYAGALNPDWLNMVTAMFTNQWLTRWPYNNFYFYFGPALIWLVLAGLVRFNRSVYAFRYFLFSLVIPVSYITIRSLQFFNSTSWFNSLDIWRSMFVFCFGLAMIVSIGVGNILNKERFQRWLALLCGLFTMGLAIWTIYSSMHIFRKYIILLLAAVGMLMVAFSMSKKTIVLRFLGIYVALAATLITSALFFVNDERFGIIASNSSLIRKLSFYNTLGEDSYGKEGNWRVSVSGPTDNTTSLVGLKTLPNYTSIYNKKMEDALRADGLIKPQSTHPYWMQLDNPDASALSFYGVRFLVALDNILAPENMAGWVKRADLSWYLYAVWENKHYIGRAYLVKASGERYSGNVEFLEDTPVSVTLRAKAEEGESLVLADLNYPGWQTWVDGRLVPTEVYHGCLRLVELSKGTHIVQWKYNGRIQWLGIILSLIALFFLVAFLIILSVFKKKENK